MNVAIRPTENVSEYEKRRLENIERNARYLADLGLSSTLQKRNFSTSTNTNKSSSKKKPKVSSVVESIPIEGLRRSSRVASMEPVTYKEV